MFSSSSLLALTSISSTILIFFSITFGFFPFLFFIFGVVVVTMVFFTKSPSPSPSSYSPSSISSPSISFSSSSFLLSLSGKFLLFFNTFNTSSFVLLLFLLIEFSNMFKPSFLFSLFLLSCKFFKAIS